MTNAASDNKTHSAEASPNPLAVLKPARIPRLYTLAEFMRKEEKALYKHEYHNGKINKMPYAKLPHNLIGTNIPTALNNALAQNHSDFMILNSNQMVYIPHLNTGLYPDVLVICDEPRFFDDDQYLLLNPTLIVEVLSKSTRKYDRGNKFDHYKSIPSFREYVLIEQDKISVESWFRVEPDLWREQKVTKGFISLDSIQITLSLKDLYRNVPGLQT